MKHFIVSCLVLLTAIIGARCFFSGSVEMSVGIQHQSLKRLKTEYASSCKELDQALHSFENCTTDAANTNNETACSIFENHYSRCSKPYFESLKRCLPSKSQDVPDLILQSKKSLVSYLCRSNGEHLFEFFNGCLFARRHVVSECERETRKKLEVFKSVAPTRDELCEVVGSAGPCLSDHLEKSCGNQITRDAIMGLFNAFVAPCKIDENKKQIVKNNVSESETSD